MTVRTKNDTSIPDEAPSGGFLSDERRRRACSRRLKELTAEDRKVVGDDIRDCEFAWPIGLPLCRAMKTNPSLHEVRSHLTGKRIARVLFCMSDGEMVLLHGFIKKTQRTPDKELDVAARRAKEVKANE